MAAPQHPQWEHYAELDIDHGHQSFSVAVADASHVFLGGKNTENGGTIVLALPKDPSITNNKTLQSYVETQIRRLEDRAVGKITLGTSFAGNAINPETVIEGIKHELNDQRGLPYAMRFAAVSSGLGIEDAQTAHELALDPPRAQAALSAKDEGHSVETRMPFEALGL